MNYIVFIIFGILLFFFLLILFSKNKHKPSLLFKKNLKIEPSIRHPGLDTGNYPKPPRPLSSSFHSGLVQSKLDKLNTGSCCTDLENELVEQAKDIFDKKNAHLHQGSLACEKCKYLENAWNNYFATLGMIFQYEKTGNLPEAPKDKKTLNKTSCCNDLQNGYKKHAEEIRDETKLILEGKQTFQRINMPKTTFGSESCSECRNLAFLWINYISALRGIARIKILEKRIQV